MLDNNISIVYHNVFNMIKYRKLKSDVNQLSSLEIIKQIKSDDYIEITADNKHLIIYLFNYSVNNIDIIFDKWNKEFEKKVEEKKIFELLIITEKPLKIPSQKFITEKNRQFIKYGIVKNPIYLNFIDNIPNHISVPEHRIMQNNEVQKFLEENKLEKNELSIIKKNESMAIWLGARPGQLIEIKRPHESCVYELGYRICK